jgi:hypothetical protein
MRALFIAAAILSAPSLGHANERPSFVPAPTANEQRLDGPALAALLVEGATECGEYDAESHTCDSMSIYTRKNGDILMMGLALMSAEPEIGIAIEGPVHVKGDSVCADMATADIRVIARGVSSEVTSPIEQEVRREMRKMGQVCSTYTREGEDFLVRAWKQDGEELDPADRVTSRFFQLGANVPKLRVMESNEEEDA